MERWFYKINGETIGPVSKNEVLNRILKGQIKCDTPLSDNAGETWEIADNKNIYMLGKFLFIFNCMVYFLIVFGGLVLIFTGNVIDIMWGFIVIISLISFIKKRKFLLIYILAIFSLISIYGKLSKGDFLYPDANERFHCYNNIKQLAEALKNYAVDNDGYFPPYDGVAGLKLLLKNEYITDTNLYMCKKVDTENTDGDIQDKHIGYVYRGGIKNILANAEIPLLWDKYGNHKNYGYVLYVDGSIKRLSGADWKEKLKEPGKRVEQ